MKIFNLSTREGYGQFVSVAGICTSILLSSVKEFEHFVNGLLFMSRAQSKFTHSEWI